MCSKRRIYLNHLVFLYVECIYVIRVHLFDTYSSGLEWGLGPQARYPAPAPLAEPRCKGSGFCFGVSGLDGVGCARVSRVGSERPL
jgi:hypothetical protein